MFQTVQPLRRKPAVRPLLAVALAQSAAGSLLAFAQHGPQAAAQPAIRQPAGQSNQGCEAQATLGNRAKSPFNPNRVVPIRIPNIGFATTFQTIPSLATVFCWLPDPLNFRWTGQI